MSRDTPAAVLVDSSGNQAKYFLQGSDYVVGARAILYDYAGNALVTDEIDSTRCLATSAALRDGSRNALESMLDNAGNRRLKVNADFPPGQPVLLGNRMPDDPADIVRDYCRNGDSDDMTVDGSSTPVSFTYEADASDDLHLYEVRFALGAQNIYFYGDKFADQPALTNGVQVLATYNNGSGPLQLANILINEDFGMFPSPGNVILNNTGPKDIWFIGLFLGGGVYLKAGSSDKIEIKIRDDLSATAYTTFKAQVFGIKE
jgi:hypothetical protein